LPADDLHGVGRVVGQAGATDWPAAAGQGQMGIQGQGLRQGQEEQKDNRTLQQMGDLMLMTIFWAIALMLLGSLLTLVVLWLMLKYLESK
jgi:hypothetical protein